MRIARYIYGFAAAFLVSSLLIFPATLYAKHPSSVRQVIQGSGSSFDLVLLRISQELEDVRLMVGPELFIDVEYDQGKNRIIINSFSFAFIKNVEQAKNYCRELFRAIRLELFVDPDTGKPDLLEGSSLLPTFFAHLQYEEKGEFEELLAELDGMTEIHALFFIRQEDKKKAFGEVLTCEGPLVGRKILFSE